MVSFIGQKPGAFIRSFIFLFILSTIIYVAGNWDQASKYNLEPPLVALVLGLIISNVIGLPRWLDAGFRVEFYIACGIVLLGATLPFTLIIWAGPVAILQASIVSLVTFFVIFFVARKLGLDHRLAAVLGAGGAVCGVSASIAVAGAVRAKKEHPPIAISLVVFWAIVLIFALPLVSRAIHLPTGVAGAWIGTSEFADAAGLAAAQSLWWIGRCKIRHCRNGRPGTCFLHIDQGHRTRYLDRYLVVCISAHFSHRLGTFGNQLKSSGRPDMVALSQIRDRVPDRFGTYDIDRSWKYAG